MKKTNKDKVVDILLKQGWIDNFYCVDNRISLRLSDIILKLQQNDGWEFDEEKSGYLNPKQKKNWYYIVKKFPYKTREITLSNGEKIVKVEKI